MRAAGLLDINVPADFSIPDPARAVGEEDPLGEEDTDAPEFHQDFLE
jgi:segregation and condensation protein B